MKSHRSAILDVPASRVYFCCPDGSRRRADGVARHEQARTRRPLDPAEHPELIPGMLLVPGQVLRERVQSSVVHRSSSSQPDSLSLSRTNDSVAHICSGSASMSLRCWSM